MPIKPLEPKLVSLLRRRIAYKTASQPSGCLVWTGSTNPDGHPQLWLSHCDHPQMHGHRHYVARVVWICEHGYIRDRHRVIHSCGDVRCIALDHLALARGASGPPKGQGSGSRGVENIHARLDADSVKQIRADHTLHKIPYVALAKQYDVSPDTIAKICKRQTWKHIK